jgi:probable HAF family extracellular repeat protein
MRSLSCVRSVLVLVTIVLGTGWVATPASAQPMVGLGSLPGATGSAASAVSADGSTVVGSVYYNYQASVEAFVWTAATGMVGLGNLPFPGADDTGSAASGVSADGSTVVGIDYAIYIPPNNFEINESIEAFVWTPATGRVGLGGLPGAPPQYGTSSPYAVATGVSADGSTVVGQAANAQNRYEAFVWTAATGMVGLGTLPGATSSYAAGVSSDGSTVVGNSGNQAFIWKAATGMVGLGTLAGATSANALGVSADGTTVVGYSGNRAFIWKAATGMVGLGTLPDSLDPYSYATGVSADGSTVVGNGGGQAFVWTAATGMVGLGYFPGTPNPFSVALGVSADGLTVVGEGSSAPYNVEAFKLHVQLAPAQLILALIEQVKGLNLKYGIQNSLDSKLDAARQALGDVNNHNNVAAVNALNAFINAVNAQRGKAIPATASDSLVAAASVIVHLLH